MTVLPPHFWEWQHDNSQASGGFPHSEIRGSKGALPSPRLIAECHVLHRLLSPRHSPNALHALDPIQKTQDPRVAPPANAPEPLSFSQSPSSTDDDRPRSVHRLGKTAFARPQPEGHAAGTPPTRDDPQKRLVFLSLHDVKDHKGPNKFSLGSRYPFAA